MCTQKIDSCGDIIFANCTRYETELPEISNITNNCVTLENTTADLYEIVTDIQEQIPENLTETIETLQEQVATLQAQVEALQEENICLKDITECVNLQSIQDPCGEQITNLGQVLNYILNRLPNE